MNIKLINDIFINIKLFFQYIKSESGILISTYISAVNGNIFKILRIKLDR